MMVYPVIERFKSSNKKTILGIFDSEQRANEEIERYLRDCEIKNIYLADSEFIVDCYILNMSI